MNEKISLLCFFFPDIFSISYPVLIKAWMGGGGKGMKIVFDKKDFVSAVESARREAVSSFGDDRVLVCYFLYSFPRLQDFNFPFLVLG